MSFDENSLASIELAKEAALQILLHNAQGPFEGLPRTAGWGKVVFAGQKREADPLYSWPSNNTPIAAKGVWNGCCGPPTSISLRGDWAG